MPDGVKLLENLVDQAVERLRRLEQDRDRLEREARDLRAELRGV
jgi:hypothetical protein